MRISTSSFNDFISFSMAFLLGLVRSDLTFKVAIDISFLSSDLC